MSFLVKMVNGKQVAVPDTLTQVPDPTKLALPQWTTGNVGIQGDVGPLHTIAQAVDNAVFSCGPYSMSRHNKSNLEVTNTVFSGGDLFATDAGQASPICLDLGENSPPQLHVFAALRNGSNTQVTIKKYSTDTLSLLGSVTLAGSYSFRGICCNSSYVFVLVMDNVTGFPTLFRINATTMAVQTWNSPTAAQGEAAGLVVSENGNYLFFGARNLAGTYQFQIADALGLTLVNTYNSPYIDSLNNLLGTVRSGPYVLTWSDQMIMMTRNDSATFSTVYRRKSLRLDNKTIKFCDRPRGVFHFSTNKFYGTLGQNVVALEYGLGAPIKSFDAGGPLDGLALNSTDDVEPACYAMLRYDLGLGSENSGQPNYTSVTWKKFKLGAQYGDV